ncbi:hypothetical protein, partial [Brevundimonas sp.]|uniref:hypothetical protein n=1 Tax=Brevundimonas sp. TaxID=1871086 RepID=UPI0028B23E95
MAETDASSPSRIPSGARLQPDQVAQPDLRPDRGRGQLAQRPAVLAARHPLQHPQRAAGVDLGRQKP